MHNRQRNSADERLESPVSNGSVRTGLLMREVNDRIAELAGDWNDSGVALFVCECSDLRCAEALEITAPEFERIRSEDLHFVVVAGHEQPELERVVERNARYVVVASRAAADEPERGWPVSLP